MATLLIVDDEPSILSGLKAALNDHGDHILTASNGLEALKILKKNEVDLLISDIRMPEMDGLTLQDEALKINPDMTVILLTAYGSVETAVEAMRRGAFDFLTKPVNLDKFEMVVKRALETKTIQKENKRLKKELDLQKGLKGIIGHSKVMQNLFDRIKTIAETKSTVLITGESGTGKELVARAIHDLSERKKEPFLVVNCAALSENLLESELFGHEKGAFTGAHTKKEGRFKLADKGTLFLDEIGELSPAIQVKLLRVIQEKAFERVGSATPLHVDVRFITATNKSLEELVKKGEFREDLYFRLNVVKIEAPPLRQRKDDIPLLIKHFLGEFAKENNKNVKEVSQEVLEQLVDYSWPGNVRELKNTVENMVVFAKSSTLTLNDLPEPFQKKELVSQTSNHKTTSFNRYDNEKELLISALKEAKYNKTLAAKMLGMSRRTIHRKIKEYGIDE